MSKETFLLNGIEEKILTFPKNENDMISITMGGRNEYSTTLLFKDFSDMTGLNLEQVLDFFSIKVDDGIATLKELLKSAEMKQKDNTYEVGQVFFYDLSFENKFGEKFYITYELFFSENGYKAVISKFNNQSFLFCYEYFSSNKDDLEYLTKSSLRRLDRFMKHKAKIIPSFQFYRYRRKISKDMIPYLFHDETLKDYFESSKKIAGIVINKSGRYEVFTSQKINSEQGVVDKIIFAHRDYKTLRFAENYLNTRGYDLNGKLTK